MGIFDSEPGIIMLRERITPTNARSWAGRLLCMLSKRDIDDLTRLEARIGQKALVRYLVCQDHDPMFCKTPTESAYKRFAERVETAYHDLLPTSRGHAIKRRGQGSMVERENEPWRR